MEHDDIIGARFEFIYSDETYLIEVISKERLRWTRIAGKNEGQTDEERYVFSSLTKDRFMLTWIEADGLGLSNVLCANEGLLTTHANLGRDVFVNIGKLVVLG